MQNLNWQEQKQNQSYNGQQKQGYTITYVPDLQSIVLFGGSHSKTNQVYLYHIMRRSWSVQKTFYPKRMSRKYHTAHYQNSIKALVMYGGEAEQGRSLDTLDILFIDDWKWRKLALNKVPSAREYHTFTQLQSGNFLIFGGITLPYGTFLNDLWVIKGINQIKDSSTLQIAGCSASQVLTKGNKPSGRHSHMAYSSHDYYFIIGGQAQSPQQSFTVYSLHIRKLIWSKHNFNMIIPQIRGFSVLPNQACNDQIFIFGGILLNHKKPNKDIYCLNISQSPKLQHLSRCPTNIPIQTLNNSCPLPFQQIYGISCAFTQAGISIHKIYISQEHQHLSIQQYLRQIKNQQILSQELINKSSHLQLLYRQIQSYSSSLHTQYQGYAQKYNNENQEQNYDEQEQRINLEIQLQKKQQINCCMHLKEQYRKIGNIYQENLLMLRNAREELARINQNFQGCIETERDEDL